MRFELKHDTGNKLGQTINVRKMHLHNKLMPKASSKEIVCIKNLVQHKRGLKHETKCLMQNKEYKPAQERSLNLYLERGRTRSFMRRLSAVKFYTVQSKPPVFTIL